MSLKRVVYSFPIRQMVPEDAEFSFLDILFNSSMKLSKYD